MREVVVITDVHYAAHWDHIREFFAAHPQSINPNQQLRDFVRASRLLDPSPSVISLGDAVDYLDAEYVGAPGHGLDNRARFYREIDGLVAEFHEVPGNHDHRRGAYNVRAWGLDQLNIDRATLERHLAIIGHYRLRRPSQELRAVFSPKTPLADFRGVRRPTYRQVGGFDTILVNTHGDGYFSLPDLLSTIAGVAVDRWHGRPPRIGIRVIGLTGDDLVEIGSALDHCRRDPVLICMHAPLLNPAPGTGRHCVSLEPDRFIRSRRRHRLDHNTVSRGGGELLRLLCEAARREQRNFVVLAGHAHEANYFLVDASSYVAREVGGEEFNASWADHRLVKHATVLPLGVINPHVALPRTGYARVGELGMGEIVTREFPNRNAGGSQDAERGKAA